MQILNKSEGLTTKDIYFLTMAPSTQSMKTVKGQRLEVDKWVVYQDIDKKTEQEMRVLAIKTPENETFATNSETFINDFCAMMELFTNAGETVPAISVISGTSKAGREFITCVYSE